MDKLCIGSLVVQAEPARLGKVRNRIEAVDGAEVMGEGELGRPLSFINTTIIRKPSLRPRNEHLAA